MSYFKTFSLLLLFLALASCNNMNTPKAPLDEEFTLVPGEQVFVENTNIGITLQSVGLEWDPDLGDEFAVVEITVLEGSDEQIFELQVGHTLSLDEFEIHLHGTDPTGTYESSFSVSATD